MKDFNQSISLNPKNSKAYFNRAIAKYNLKQTKDACIDFIKANELGYKDPDDLLSKYCK